MQMNRLCEAIYVQQQFLYQFQYVALGVQFLKPPM